MQTKTIFRPALALLLCGAAMLGLGPWENAAGQGQAPILFSENPQGFNECIVNDGVFAIVGDEGDAQCTPRPPGWTPPPPPPEVAPQPGGIIIQEPVVAPPPAANPAPRRVPQQSTVVLDFKDHLDYGDFRTCGNLGGKTEFYGSIDRKAICSEIDINDTFCFVDSKDAFPCAGLFRHVGVCNGLYNRPALDPWHCAALCPPEKYACGNRCLRGGIAPPPRFVDSRKRIPYVAGNYSGEVFQLTATMKAGNVRLGLAEAGPDLAVTPVGRARDVAAVKLSRPIGAGSQRAGTLRAGFSCAGPEQAFGATMFAFTISALAAVTEFEREAPARINPTLANPTLFGTNSPGIYIPDVYERVQVTRTGGNFELESSVYDSQDVEAEALVVRGTLEYFQAYTLHLDAVSPQVRGAVSLVVKTSIRCARFRWDDYDGLVEFPDFSNSYRKLTVALASGDANAMCEALRIGADPNREIWNPKGRKTERVLSFPTFTVTQTRYYPTATTPMLQLLSRTEATPRLYQMVKALVENGVDPDFVSTDEHFQRAGDRLLHYAAARGDAATPAVRALLDQGADIHAFGYRGHTPLHRAANGRDNLATFTTVLERTATVNIGADNGSTPLHWANSPHAAAKVAALLRRGAETNRRDGSGRTPAYYMVLADAPGGLRALRDNGADLTIADDRGLTPLAQAVFRNNLVLARIMLEASDSGVNRRFPQGRNVQVHNPPPGSDGHQTHSVFVAARTTLLDVPHLTAEMTALLKEFGACRGAENFSASEKCVDGLAGPD